MTPLIALLRIIEDSRDKALQSAKYKMLRRYALHIDLDTSKTIRVILPITFQLPTSRNEQRLRFVEMHSTNRAIMLIKAVDERAHSIIPELDYTTVQTGKDPWAPWMKG